MRVDDKGEILSAYRNIPVHPDDRALITWHRMGRSAIRGYSSTVWPQVGPEDFFGCRRCGPMDCRESWVQALLHYLDDFLIIGAPNSSGCQASLSILLGTFHQLGFPVAPEKLESPTTFVTFLGQQIDSVAQKVRLPGEELTTLLEVIHSWLGRRSCT